MEKSVYIPNHIPILILTSKEYQKILLIQAFVFVDVISVKSTLAKSCFSKILSETFKPINSSFDKWNV